MDEVEIEELELDLFLEAIQRRHDYDFRQYSRASLKRRVKSQMEFMGLNRISQMIEPFLYEEKQIFTLINSISVTVTEMFRNPTVFQAIREKVFPILQTYPKIKIWHAGCATGEEVYSLAIFLKEANLYDRCEIIATDINPKSLDVARKGIYAATEAKTFTVNYQKAGGSSSFSDYYYAKYNKMMMVDELKENIQFIEHNLVRSRPFDSMHFIICRNVLIYFNKELQGKVLNLFKESLITKGFLCLGTKEALSLSSVENNFDKITIPERIYRLKSIA